MKSALVSLEKVQEYLQLEPIFVILGLAALSWILYKTLLRKISDQRHQNLRRLFVNLLMHILFGLTLYGIYSVLLHWPEESRTIQRIVSYVGLVCIIQGLLIFVKTCRILVFEYLFFGNMRAGVPLLLVNLFSLALSLVLATWVANEIFGVRLAPLLTTSAIFSIVFGLALQDTLGNLFAGVSLQIDKPYEIGDWVEVQNGLQRWVGQVIEITWRATALIGLNDESKSIPNRIMAQAEISNFSAKHRPFQRSHVFHVSHGADINAAKRALLSALDAAPAIIREPAPLVLVTETTESWVNLRLVYSLVDYGAQFQTTDIVISQSLKKLKEAGIPLANSILEIHQHH